MLDDVADPPTADVVVLLDGPGSEVPLVLVDSPAPAVDDACGAVDVEVASLGVVVSGGAVEVVEVLTDTGTVTVGIGVRTSR